MDLLDLAFGYLIAYFMGVPLSTLFSQFYDNDRAREDERFRNESRSDPNSVYDFIIVGAGSAGCVVANRLSAQNYRVLLLEAGGNPFPLTLVPEMEPKMLGRRNIDWSYHTVPQKYSFQANRNKRGMVNRGKGLGGTSLLNYRIDMRGSPYDFDDWANKTGDDSWSYENLLPFFKLLENYQGNFHNDYYHGQNGPVYIESGQHGPMTEKLLQAGREMGLKVKDPNGFQGESVFPFDTTTKQGTRFSTHRAYLYPVMGRPNLRVITYAHVEKIIFDERNRAVEVSYNHMNQTYQAVAIREIIVSCGAIASPQLLMLSGVGPQDHLQSFGIPVRVNLPVGQNLRDHISTFVGPIVVDNAASILGSTDRNYAALERYINTGKGPFGSDGVEGGVLLKTSLATTMLDWPEIYALVSTDVMSPDSPEHWQHLFDFAPGVLQQYMHKDLGKGSFFYSTVLCKPRSSGTIRLASADPNVDPLIDPNYFSHPNDVMVMVEGIKILLEMGTKTNTFRQIGARFTDSLFPGCEFFPHLSDEYLDCFVRHFSGTLWHYSGTCKMGIFGDPDAVVDSRLRVLGTTGLRVIDTSIMPQVTTANTNIPAIMIGEKGSQMILDDWAGH